jgi:hypothetical protein
MKNIREQFLYRSFFWLCDYECYWTDERTRIVKSEEILFLPEDPQISFLINEVARKVEFCAKHKQIY